MTVDVSKHLDRAKRGLERNKLEDVVDAYQSVLNDVPGHFEALQGLGDIYTRLGQADRAAVYYGTLFDRFFDAREDNKALAIYTRALKGVQQPPERMARYALLLQRQNRAEEAMEQYGLASELLLARGKEELALDCLERVAQLDPENAERQYAAGELAERLGKKTTAARAFLRAGQLSEVSGTGDAAIELYSRAHQLVPNERGPALLYAQAMLRRDDPAAAAKLLEPFVAGDADAKFLSTFGEALMGAGELDRAAAALERLPAEQPSSSVKLFDLADRYLAENQNAKAVELLGKTQQSMAAVRRDNDFAAHLDALVAAHSDSIPLAEFWAAAYAKLNRETKYFEALVRLFDLYIAAGNVASACDAFEKIVDIDPYDARNQQRLQALESRADETFLTRLHQRLARVATRASEPLAERSAAAPALAATEQANGQPSLEDMIVQAEIFAQYSLQPKAVERLQKIVQMFPGEVDRNERLRNLCQLANWWPPETKSPAAATSTPTPAPVAIAEPASAAAPAVPGTSADTMRDLAKISELSQSLFRQPSPKAILSAAVNGTGEHLQVTRCIALIGPINKPQLTAEFCAQGVQAASWQQIAQLGEQMEKAQPDALGGLVVESAAAAMLKELGLESALGVPITDRETQTRAGMLIAGNATGRQWRPNETYFLQAVGDQMLLGVNHANLRTRVRNVGVADEKTGLLARSSYQDCLLAETQRAKSQGIALTLTLLQIDRGPELLRQHGEAQVERYLEQLARTFTQMVRQADHGVKYNSWALAFILPETTAENSRVLVDKLKNAGSMIPPPWEGSVPTLSASVAEAVAKPEFDSEDIVTELMNRAETGLDEAHKQGGNAFVSLPVLKI